ncbi:hypothetical protein ACTI_40000 [Actinoplanes sp. OR16]|uniref:DUF559 domain-containing protein n=1 Tax=Actinoplanes sp. OR16 TaxID=946334 RepID=UPI000F6CAA32|nr:DUF559 domain-containing protein [Actinoplanes sp. OR16]BBH67315.1 hypothetical protein ACTI_40000 [Actinoplanes sp. OR16]
MPSPASLSAAPFRGSGAVAAGLITWSRLRGTGWRRLLPDVYASSTLPLDHRIWCLAVALVLPPGAAIGGLSAACLWGADLLRPDSRITVATLRHRWIRRHERIVPHYTVFAEADRTFLPALPPPVSPSATLPHPVTTPSPNPVTTPFPLPITTPFPHPITTPFPHPITTPFPLPVTTPARTAFDLGRRLSRSDAVVAMDALLRVGVLDLSEVIGMSTERRHWPRTAQLDEVLRLADGRAESPMESRMRLLFHDAGLLRPQPQYEVRDGHGRLLGRVDLAWEAARVAAEYEGDHHRERARYQRDVARINALHRAGWSVLRFTADDILRNPRRTVAMLATELSRRS